LRLANIAVDGRGHVADESSTPIAFVTLGYLRTMRIPMIAGRDFDERDRLGAERVVIVNEAFQRRFAPDGNIVGARITAIWRRSGSTGWPRMRWPRARKRLGFA
jgi:hypothetical protein